MRQIDLNQPQTVHSPRQARLVRHLNGRLHDLAVGWPEVIAAEEPHGFVQVRFPEWDAAQLADALRERGVSAQQQEDCLIFHLPPDLPFEHLDRVWGILFELIPAKYQ